MKKLLLSLLAVAGLTFASSAETVTFVPEGSAFSGTATTTIPNGNCVGTDYVAGNITINLEKLNNSTSNVTGGLLRWYQNDKLHITPAAGTTITSVVIYAASDYSNNKSAEVSALEADPSKLSNKVSEGGKITWEGSSEVALVLQATKQIRFSALEVTYTAGTVTPPAIAAPVITCADNMVTITAEDADAVYYTLDGTNPTVSSTKYTAPFAITKNVTVKAIATKGTDVSNVTSFNATFTGTYDGYESFLKDAGKGTVGTIAGPITAIYQNGINLYTVDSKGTFMLLYGAQDGTYVNGDQFDEITGKYSPYNDLPEMADVTLGTKTTGTAVEPETVAIEEIALDQCNKYIKIEDVEITYTGTGIDKNTEKRTYTATDADGNEITLYNAFHATSNSNGYTVIEIPEGEGFTVTGFVCRYGETLQITPIKFEGGKVMETVETPVFNPEAGPVEAGTTVTITCATEDAAIYYTLDGSTPTVSATEYTAPIAIDEAVTIKAIAVKEGMLNSTVATAEYTIILAGTKVATFDFEIEGNVATLTTSEIEGDNTQNKEGDANDLNDVKFVNEEVTMYILKDTGNSPRWWKATSNKVTYSELRFYNGNTVVVSINKDGYRLIEVDFVQGHGSSFPAADKMTFTPAGTYSNRVWTAPADNCTEMKMAAGATANVGKVVVTYVEADGAISGVENIAAADENAPAEYYNLQGVRVANPTPGLYIVKKGNTVTKQIIR